MNISPSRAEATATMYREAVRNWKARGLHITVKQGGEMFRSVWGHAPGDETRQRIHKEEGMISQRFIDAAARAEAKPRVPFTTEVEYPAPVKTEEVELAQVAEAQRKQAKFLLDRIDSHAATLTAKVDQLTTALNAVLRALGEREVTP